MSSLSTLDSALSTQAKALGDFQTPLALVREVLVALDLHLFSRVLEPTCGRGSFIRGLLELEPPPQEVIGVELQPHYVEEARAISDSIHLRILNADIFSLDFRHDLCWQTQGPLLVVGNPPWITNAAQGRLHSDNLPPKSNFKQRRGIEALTGHSNFDLAESIWIKLITELADEQVTIALLCKTAVARSVLQYAYQAKIGVADASIRRIDAKRWFGAAVNACLFTLRLEMGAANYEVQEFDSLTAFVPERRIGYAGAAFVSDVKKYLDVAFLDGQSHLEWRQGVKHDAAAIMELIAEGDCWRNGDGERVDIEREYIHPLVKGADLQSNRARQRGVIIPQTRIGQDTRLLERRAPNLWRYLTNHAAAFEARKSSIYRGKPPFSIFGVGPYSFAPYKVLVSGLHKRPRFVVVGPHKGRPVLCDDTCYLLPFDSAREAAQVAAALNHPLAQQFIESIAFRDAKRPITKSVLSRINIGTLLQSLSSDELADTHVYKEATHG
jgi:hypothetical protein